MVKLYYLSSLPFLLLVKMNMSFIIFVRGWWLYIFHQMCDDDNLSLLWYNIAWVLIIICAISFLIQLVLSVRVGNVGDVHATICVYIIAMCLTGSLTDGMKHYCGYLRPIFYEECEPNFETGVCAKDSAYVRKSFPSGHASTSFCFMTLLTCYLVQRYGVTSRMTPYSSIISDGDKKEFMIQYKVRQPTYLQRIISLVSFIPMVLAFFVAGSRVHDNHHHPGKSCLTIFISKRRKLPSTYIYMFILLPQFSNIVFYVSKTTNKQTKYVLITKS